MQHSPSVQPESPSVTSISLSDPCQHTRDQSQLLYFSFSWDRTARAGGSWCCCLALPALCSIPTSENSSLPQWNGKTSPLQGVSRDSAYLGFTSTSATNPLPVTICPWFPTVYLEQFYLLCLSCLFAVVFWNCLLLLCLLVYSMHCSFTGAL